MSRRGTKIIATGGRCDVLENFPDRPSVQLCQSAFNFSPSSQTSCSTRRKAYEGFSRFSPPCHGGIIN